MTTALEADPDGRLVDNIVHFTRALRKAGVKVGTAQVETAIEAVEAAGFSKRIDFYHILRATLIARAEHLEVFHQVFAMFWRDPEFLSRLMKMLSPELKDDTPPDARKAAQRRAEDAMGASTEREMEPPRTEIEQYAVFSWSGNEVIKRKDFEQMSAEEMAEAEAAVRNLALPVKPLRIRRTKPTPNGPRADARATLRAACRKGGEIQTIARKAPRTRPPDLVALCDISGSMSVYSRMILRYLHAVTHAPERSWGRVHGFTFGTELTNVTRSLRLPDPDQALARTGQDALDWEGGTKIGAALERFNKDWARRVLTTGAVVLLITDGLERDDLELLSREAARLKRSVRRLIWLNPLLRWEGFAPQAGGIQKLLPHVDSFHACHSLDSLQDLSMALGTSVLKDAMLAQSRALAR